MEDFDFEFLIENENIGTRVDVFLSDKLNDFTRSRIQKLIENNEVLINDRSVSKNYKLCKNDCVKLNVPEPENINIEPENIPIDIVYEDDFLLVVNKQKGMVVHPAPGNYSKTLVNALMYHCKGNLSGINGKIRPGIVHRIDKDTSGLVVIAKNDIAHNSLAEQFAVHSIDREYHAVVYGNVKNNSGTVNAPIGRHPVNRKQMAVTQNNSKPAITHYDVIERLNGFTYIKCRLETGRTHQIRVHMASLGHPVAGDEVYGPKKVIKELNGQCLHAKILGFTHPISGEKLCFESELPDYFTSFLRKVCDK